MKLTRLIPQIFYSDVQVGLRFFNEGLGFVTVYEEADRKFFIVKRDEVTVILNENDQLAKQDRPEIRIGTDDIESYFDEIKRRAPRYLHPNLNEIRQQPWGLREFALLDESTVCVIIQQD